MAFHRGCCRILSIATETEGELTRHRPTLYISNHISYLDVFVLGGTVPGCFIAKSEVAGWPVLGQLARIQNTLFFERRGSRAHSQIAVMTEHLSAQGNLILFPEGTSTEGEHVEPFKSSLFHAAEVANDVLIQPITIAFTTLRGRPMNRSLRDYFAWYADMPFTSHFFKMTGMGRVTAKMVFHKPVRLADFPSRKACADYCQRQVSAALDKTLSETGCDRTSDEVPVDLQPGQDQALDRQQ